MDVELSRMCRADAVETWLMLEQIVRRGGFDIAAVPDSKDGMVDSDEIGPIGTFGSVCSLRGRRKYEALEVERRKRAD